MQYSCPIGKFRVIDKDESISAIAEKYAISTNKLIETNPYLNPTYYLAGQVIVVPDECGMDYGMYTVSKGENLCDVLRKSDISAAELISMNPSTDIFMLEEGVTLKLPLKEVNSCQYYTLKSGENLQSICKKYDISKIILLKMNPNLRPSEFVEGQTIRISNE